MWNGFYTVFKRNIKKLNIKKRANRIDKTDEITHSNSSIIPMFANDTIKYPLNDGPLVQMS